MYYSRRPPWVLGTVAISLLSTASAFYLPGAAPHDYTEGEAVDLYVNALTPMLAGSDNAKLVCSRAVCIAPLTLMRLPESRSRS